LTFKRGLSINELKTKGGKNEQAFIGVDLYCLYWFWSTSCLYEYRIEEEISSFDWNPVDLCRSVHFCIPTAICIPLARVNYKFLEVGFVRLFSFRGNLYTNNTL
jgi:hypothetical protein